MNFDVKQILDSWARVLRVAKKPDFADFSASAKVCFAGLLVVGAVGFVVYLISVA